MAYSEPTAQFPTALVTAADLLKPENDATSTTLLQNITSGSPAAGGKLYVNDNANFSTNGGVALIDSTTELIGYSATGSDGTGDYLTVDQRAYPGGSAASAASSGDTVKDVVSAEHFKRAHVELIATQTYLGTNAGQTAPIADSVLAGTGAGVSSWDTTPTVAGLTINGASGNTLVVDTTTLVVDATNGRVGIGTTGPGRILEVNAANAHLELDGTTEATLILRDNGYTSGQQTFGIKGRSGRLDFVAASDDYTTTQNIRLTIEHSSGNVGIGETSPGAQLHVVAGAAGTVGCIIDTAASPTADIMQWQYNGSTRAHVVLKSNKCKFRIGSAFTNGTAEGPYLEITRQADGTTPAAGFVYMEDKSGTFYAIWPDDSGLLRINGALVTNAGDTAGTVVGDQTSLLAAKDLLDNLPAPSDSLQYLLEAKDALRQFVYKADEQGNRKYGGQEFFGLVTDFAPRYGKDNGKSLNEITLFGDIVNAISEIVSRIERLEATV